MSHSNLPHLHPRHKAPLYFLTIFAYSEHFMDMGSYNTRVFMTQSFHSADASMVRPSMLQQASVFHCFSVVKLRKFTQHKINHFKVLNSVALSIFTKLCSQAFPSPQKETPYPLAVTLQFSLSRDSDNYLSAFCLHGFAYFI